MHPPLPPPSPSLPHDAVSRLHDLLADGRRKLLALVGPPGSGKSTLAQALQQRFADVAQVVPMDGFHLAAAELQRLGRADRKGAPDTFDAAGCVALLRRLREQRGDEVVYAPEFRREIEEPVAGAIAVAPAARLVIVEGNYLLLDEVPWRDALALFDDSWYVEVDHALRLERLIRRHEHFGRSREQAVEWVQRSDEANARRIEATRGRARFVIRAEDGQVARP